MLSVNGSICGQEVIGIYRQVKKMNKESSFRFDEATEILSPRIKSILQKLPDDVKENTWEIRIRNNMPVMLVGSYGKRFSSVNSKMNCLLSGSTLIALDGEIGDTFNRLCGYSLHSHQSQIRDVYITIKGGHRAGFCGSAVFEN